MCSDAKHVGEDSGFFLVILQSAMTSSSRVVGAVLSVIVKE